MMRLLLLAALTGGAIIAAEAPPATARSDDGDRLFPGDQIRIEVFDNPDLSVSLTVPGRGTIAFPLIGDLPDLTSRSARDLGVWIQERLADGYLRHPQVTVTVVSFGVRQVHVLGSVGRAGAIRIQPGTTLSALQAISEAGGFDPQADRAGCILIRTGSDGQRTTVALPLVAGDASADPTLQPGDVVVVPASDRAFVLGRVTRPGPVLFQGTEPITVARALSLVGGFDRFAVERAVQLLRPGSEPRTIDVQAILGGTAPDVPLRPGDTLFVPESRF